jgi:acyl carrier protein
MEILVEFPEKEIDAAIRDEIARAPADRPPTKGGWQPEVDSLVVIMVTLRVERELGITLPETAMPVGGFEDIESCVRSVLEQCRGVWTEKQRQKEEQVS